MQQSYQPQTNLDRTPSMTVCDPPPKTVQPRRPALLRWGLSVLIVTTLAASSPVRCETVLRDLSDAEEASVLAGSAGVLVLGRVVESRRHQPVIGNGYQPNALDAWMRRLIHGGVDTTTNFLDNKFGSALTPMLGVTALSLLDINRDGFGRDIPFFLAGIAATKGITDITKGIVGRPRPYCVDGGCPPPQLDDDDPYHQSSFFSGHASAAFFTATFLNKRFRRHMRQNWTADEYRTGRVLSPIVSFGWASFVGFSRIHADRHYFTDVAAGALAGSLMGELYYYLAYNSADPSDESKPASSHTPLFVLSFPIN